MKNSFRFFLNYSTAALILAAPFITTLEAALAQVRFVAPPVSAPGNREAGASRQAICGTNAEDENLTALISETNSSQNLTALVPETNIGLTTQGLPSLFAYVPANNADVAELRLFEEDSREEVYAGQVALPIADEASDYRHPPSVLQLSLPEDEQAIALEPGKDYIWELTLVCNDVDDPTNGLIIVIGLVQRTNAAYLDTLDATIRDQLSEVNQVSAAEKLTVYGKAGIWYELLETLASLVESDPATYQDDWVALLEAQGLGAIANAPIIPREVVPLTLE